MKLTFTTLAAALLACGSLGIPVAGLDEDPTFERSLKVAAPAGAGKVGVKSNPFKVRKTPWHV